MGTHTRTSVLQSHLKKKKLSVNVKENVLSRKLTTSNVAAGRRWGGVT